METNNAESLENSTKNTVINKQNEEINLLSLSVVRRDGSITPFKSDKIANAIRKAFWHKLIFVIANKLTKMFQC